MPAEVQIEGLQEFQRAVRRSTDTELPKRLGQAHKAIGQMVIARLNPPPDPLAVGAGAGAAVRASAKKREVVLRAGGAHRASGGFTRLQPWGKRRLGAIGILRPKRPHIRGTIDDNYDDIADAYLEAISAAMSGAFHDTKP